MFLLHSNVLSAMMATVSAPDRPTATVDLMIALVARYHGASVVTRKVADFDECRVAVVNP